MQGRAVLQTNVGQPPDMGGGARAASSPTSEGFPAALLLGEITVTVDPVTGQIVSLDTSHLGRAIEQRSASAQTA
jgi:hypothetical protein